ncbi:hypothetical protein Tco_1461381 [Tanacetum coccineum]
MAPKRRTTRLNPETTPAAIAATTTTVTNAQLQAMIDQGVTAILVARDANTNGVDSHNSRTGARRNERATRECTYPDFMKCQPLNFKGKKGVVELTQWIEKMETVWICQILQEISQKRTRERMSDQEAKEIKAEAREIMPQPSTVNCS